MIFQSESIPKCESQKDRSYDLTKLIGQDPSSLLFFQDLLIQPTCKIKTYGDRAFSVYAPKLWNTIPLEIRRASTFLSLGKTSRPFFLLHLLGVTHYIFTLIF